MINQLNISKRNHIASVSCLQFIFLFPNELNYCPKYYIYKHILIVVYFFHSSFWDIFQIIAREKKTQDVHTHTSLRILKVLTYIALFLMLLACLVIQKISLATLISELRPDREGDHDTTEPVSKRVNYID